MSEGTNIASDGFTDQTEDDLVPVEDFGDYSLAPAPDPSGSQDADSLYYEDILTKLDTIANKLSIVSESSAYSFSEDENTSEAALLSESALDTPSTEDDSSVSAVTLDDIAQKLDTLIAYQEVQNANLVKGSSNIQTYLSFMSGGLFFLVGGFVVFSVFHKIKVR